MKLQDSLMAKSILELNSVLFIYNMGLLHGSCYAIAVETEVDKTDLDPEG